VVSSLTSGYPVAYRASFMTSVHPSSPEAVGQAIEDLQKVYHSGMSATIMFIWDYGELTSIYSVEWLP
jgi:hypothetical protein